MNTSNKKNNIEIERDNLIIKTGTIIRQKGTAALKIEDFTKYMDISKATFYKYFKSKDEVIAHFTDKYIRDFINFEDLAEDNNMVIDEELYLKIFSKMLFQYIFSSQRFLTDIKELYAELWEKIHLAIIRRNEILSQLYENSIEKGILKKANPNLLIIQDEVFFSQITQASFLISRNITVKQAVIDYYFLRVEQIFSEKKEDFSLSKENEEKLTSVMRYLSLVSLE